MAIRTDYSFNSTDGIHTVHAVRWVPETAPIGVVQFIHGVGENVERYAETAEYLCSRGFIVAGIDYLGHGMTAEKEEDYGFFTKSGGWNILCADIHKQYIAESKNRSLPYFLLGHSLGSFIGRTYLSLYDTPFTACLFTGSAHKSPFAFTCASLLASLIALFKGPRGRSPFVCKFTFGRFTPHYGEDHSLLPTIGMSRDIFNGMAYMSKFSTIKRMRKDIPIYFFSGTKDSVSAGGKELEKAKEDFQKAGCKDVTVKLYPGGPHTLFKSDLKEEVWHDVADWMLSKI